LLDQAQPYQPGRARLGRYPEDLKDFFHKGPAGEMRVLLVDDVIIVLD
jgi:hypothetical protein